MKKTLFPTTLFLSCTLIFDLFCLDLGAAKAEVSVTTASKTCKNQLSSMVAVPTGSGAAYNLLSTAHELLLQADSCTETNASITVGNGDASTYVYNSGYHWTGAEWQQYSLSGTEQLLDNSWYAGSAKSNIPFNEGELSKYFVGYTCQFENSAWKCGCHDSVCATPMWQLQIVVKSANPSPATSPTPASLAACAAKKIVVLGSSTAAGAGTNPSSNSWVNRYTAYLKGLNPGFTVANLAVGGYTTYHIRPTGSVPPADTPYPDKSRNITAALALHPQAIIVNMPTNDTAMGYTKEETELNFEELKSIADQAGVPIWFTTTQPRNWTWSQPDLDILIELRDWIKLTFGARSIDFWTTVANKDGSINDTYSAGDGAHLNNAGHKVLFDRVVQSGLIEELCQSLE